MMSIKGVTQLVLYIIYRYIIPVAYLSEINYQNLAGTLFKKYKQIQ